MMITYLREKHDTTEKKESKGQIMMKITQLEDSRDEEIRFMNFIKGISASDIDEEVNR